MYPYNFTIEQTLKNNPINYLSTIQKMNTVDFIIYIDDREYCKDKKIQNSFKSYDFFKNKHFTEYIL